MAARSGGLEVSLRDNIKADPESDDLYINLGFEVQELFTRLAAIPNVPPEVMIVLLEFLQDGASRAERWNHT
jgi:hypothetical protein